MGMVPISNGNRVWLVAVIAIIAFPAATCGVLALRAEENRAVEQAGRSLALSAADFLGHAGGFVAGQSIRLHTIAESSAVYILDYEHIGEHLTRVLNASPVYAWIGFLHSVGHVVAATDHNVGKNESGSAWFQSLSHGPWSADQ